MKHGIPQHQVLKKNNSKQILTEDERIVKTENDHRRTSIILMNQPEIKQVQQKQFGQKIAKAELIYRKSLSTSSLFQGLSDRQINSNSLTQKRISSNEKALHKVVSQKTQFTQISPKIVFKDDKISVHFVQEVGKFQITQENKQKDKLVIATETQIPLHEVSTSRVYLKAPTSTSIPINVTNRSFITKIPKSILSNQNMINFSKKKQIHQL